MPDDKTRKRMVVEEVSSPTETPSLESEDIQKTNELEDKTQEETHTTPEETVSIPEEKKEEAEETSSDESQKDKVLETTVEKPQEEREPMPQIKSGNGPNPLVIIIPGIFLLGALLGGIAFYQKGVSKESEEPTPTPNYNNTVTPAPTTTPEIKLDLTKYPINVMNGSGIPGQAGTVKELLETAGFKVSKTGNAPSYDYTKTVIKAKADVPTEFITKLSESLGKSYVVDTNQSLATSSADSVQVIVGSTKAK